MKVLPTPNLEVQLGARSYPIYVGSDILRNLAILEATISSGQIVIVSNSIVFELYGEILKKGLAPRETLDLLLPDGEKTKSLDTIQLATTFLIENKIKRNATIVALGGGVIGDIAGFLAACYQRGIDYVQIPTTLLAQVDSSVGGKTAVNHPLGKNMLGAFYQPKAVLSDVRTLDTLPQREFISGLSEVIKYGLISDEKFLTWIEKNTRQLLARDPQSLNYAITTSCRVKASVVTEDEKEQGNRAFLNLGHTFGHAIETAKGHGAILHGEAVAIGMRMALVMSKNQGWLKDSEVTRGTRVLNDIGLPLSTEIPGSPEAFIEIMSRDKKNSGKKIRLILLKELGRAFAFENCLENDLLDLVAKELKFT